MRDPYYVELTILESGALRMCAMSSETREAVASREIALPPQGDDTWIAKSRAAREELTRWVRNWIKRHSPKGV